MPTSNHQHHHHLLEPAPSGRRSKDEGVQRHATYMLILSLDERNRFIIMDLDDTHLLISPERIDWLRSELELEVSFSSTLQ
ncbi:hypothetical protein PANT_14c00027 [Moesziomyces antarcticus T-34]|uniref:General transcription and DNA repair factor IIH subunit TFB5 n=1 Tax=Pseudozyma antarctica (strain T-34) TaxID=1151754 RepID=M9LQV5_PSEA3|nr:hypothetical protein PANT_14c00027 [Moesziomyces antarcticus T-34]